MEEQIGFIKKELYIGEVFLSTKFAANLDTINNLNNVIFIGCEPTADEEHWKVNFIFSQNLILNLALFKMYTSGLLASGSSGNMSFILKKNDTLRFSNNLKYEDKRINYIEFLNLSKDSIKVAIYSKSMSVPLNQDIEKIREIYPDAICYAEKDLDTWRCVCGTINELSENKKIQNCSKCGKNRDYILNNFQKQ